MGAKVSGPSTGECFQCFCLRAVHSCSSTGTPLPRHSHLVLRREDVCRGGRLIIVGDVHGCAGELVKLMEKEQFDAIRDTLVFCGDLVNKGPDSGSVVRLARRFSALGVRGNHDDELLEAWYRTGRYREGLHKYTNNALPQMSSEDVSYIRELPLSLSIPWLQLIVVHAGVVPGVSLASQRFEDLLWMRDLKQAGTSGMWQGLRNPEIGSLPWADVWSGPEHVVFGHDAKRRLQQKAFATGLDTGCVYGSELTALVINPDDFSERYITSVPAAGKHVVPKSRVE